MLFIRKVSLQASGSNLGSLRVARPPFHATGYQFHNILYPDMHHVAPGKSHPYLSMCVLADCFPQVAITSPDPDFHTDAREYFTRHMRILERCSSAWPMPEIQAQIDSLRLAFSANTNRPFELKPTFPYGSPSEPYQPSPTLETQYHPQPSQISQLQERAGFQAYPITPPISASTEDSKTGTPQLQPPGMVSSHPVQTEAPLVDENSWDPTRIIK
jgi:hypothetical protein